MAGACVLSDDLQEDAKHNGRGPHGVDPVPPDSTEARWLPYGPPQSTQTDRRYWGDSDALKALPARNDRSTITGQDTGDVGSGRTGRSSFIEPCTCR